MFFLWLKLEVVRPKRFWKHLCMLMWKKQRLQQQQNQHIRQRIKKTNRMWNFLKNKQRHLQRERVLFTDMMQVATTWAGLFLGPRRETVSNCRHLRENTVSNSSKCPKSGTPRHAAVISPTASADGGGWSSTTAVCQMHQAVTQIFPSAAHFLSPVRGRLWWAGLKTFWPGREMSQVFTLKGWEVLI